MVLKSPSGGINQYPTVEDPQSHHPLGRMACVAWVFITPLTHLSDFLACLSCVMGNAIASPFNCIILFFPFGSINRHPQSSQSQTFYSIVWTFKSFRNCTFNHQRHRDLRSNWCVGRVTGAIRDDCGGPSGRTVQFH